MFCATAAAYKINTAISECIRMFNWDCSYKGIIGVL